MKVYLGGAILGCSDAKAHDWRNMATAMLRGHTMINPMVRDYRGKTDTHYREVVELDKRDVRRADVLLINHPEPSSGTDMELLYAWEHGVPAVVIVPAGTIISPWVRYHATAITNTLHEAVAWILENITE